MAETQEIRFFEKLRLSLLLLFLGTVSNPRTGRRYRSHAGISNLLILAYSAVIVFSFVLGLSTLSFQNFVFIAVPSTLVFLVLWLALPLETVDPRN